MQEKAQNFVVNGGIKLPIGYRFHPTDEELVVHYLRKKVYAFPLPALVIPEADVFQSDPWCLPGDVREKRYFFYNEKRDGNEKRSKRAAGSGYWKPIGKDKLIVTSELNQAVGVRKTLVFSDGKRPKGSKTRWFMHAYHLLGSGTTQMIYQTKMEEYCWVVCGVFQRKKRPKKDVVLSHPSNSKRNQMIAEVVRPNAVDLIVEDISSSGPPTPSLSCSSEITELCFNGIEDDQEENSDSLNCFSNNYCKR
ncbi:hypothetical protein UlMin_013865 [Ulmus minor]